MVAEKNAKTVLALLRDVTALTTHFADGAKSVKTAPALLKIVIV